MSSINCLKTLVNERLNAVAEEIFVFFEKTIIQYEEEIDRQRQLLNLALNPEINVTDHSKVFACEDQVTPEKEKYILLDQKDPEPPQVNEDHDNRSVTQNEKHLRGQEEYDVTHVPFTNVTVKIEIPEERTFGFHNNQISIEQATERDSISRSSIPQIKFESEEGCDRVTEPSRNIDSGLPHSSQPGDDQYLHSHSSENEDEYNGHGETREIQPGSLKPRKSTAKTDKNGPNLSVRKPLSRSVDLEQKSSNQNPSLVYCKVCGINFFSKLALMGHIKVHANDCGLCGKHLEPTENLKTHHLVHKTCNFCGKSFASINKCIQHVRIHTGEKPFSCTICGRRFCLKGNLKKHFVRHSGEKPFSCSVCGKCFNRKGVLLRHIMIHTGEIAFNCAD